MINIHASAIALKNGGIIILGAPGQGKSDLCLRLIVDYNASLVADDRVELNVSRETITASAPSNIFGLLEVRGQGVMELPAIAATKLRLAVELVANPQDIERMPQPQYFELSGAKIPLVRIYPFAASAPAQIIAALNYPLSTK